ncbi:MAG: hypothetical protein ACLRMJ_09380 [Alistipes finegoldii]
MNYIQIKYGSAEYIEDHEQAIRVLTNADVQASPRRSWDKTS